MAAGDQIFLDRVVLDLDGRDLPPLVALTAVRTGAIVVGTLSGFGGGVVFAVGLKLSAVMDRPWLVIGGAWLAPWALSGFTTVVSRWTDDRGPRDAA